ncbi:MAG TPA: hypothetical protein PLZ15_00195 [Melioribacteraceae bacterium]|nr:hypothetical protein [Melioribacteraceae bacterium]
MVRKFLFVHIWFFISFLSLNAQEMSVSATTDTSNYMVGDYITYTLEIRHDKYFAVYLPPIKDSIKVLDFIRALPVEKKNVGENIVEYHKFIFSKYDSGKVEIPPVRIEYTKHQSGNRHALYTNPVSLTVHTLPVNTQEDIKDVKEPVKLPLNWLLVIAIVILIAALLVGGFYLYKRFRKKKDGVVAAEPEIKLPPHEIALQKLHLLEEKKLWQQGFVKEYHSEITEIVRSYFEERFDFRALEMTSSEILGVLSYLEEGRKVVESANNFFSNADLVKFAKFQPIPSVNDEMMKQAFGIVHDTIPEFTPKGNEEGQDAR